jgi:AraC-like DNA-binding protein
MMYYQEFPPHPALKNFVQCYFVCENDTEGISSDIVFATGHMEIMFNVGTEGMQQLTYAGITNQPDIQLWGQTIEPFSFVSCGKHSMFGIRFFTHTAACFFKDPVDQFNNLVMDFKDVAGSEAALLRSRLVESKTFKCRIELADQFLLQRLAPSPTTIDKLKLVKSIMVDVSREDFFENMNTVASRYGISARYLQKLFVQYAGISPKLYVKIARFQKSLQLVADKDLSLTNIAYECGYFDQAHFIKDFKFFTGSAPSRFSPESSTEFLTAYRN